GRRPVRPADRPRAALPARPPQGPPEADRPFRRRPLLALPRLLRPAPLRGRGPARGGPAARPLGRRDQPLPAPDRLRRHRPELRRPHGATRPHVRLLVVPFRAARPAAVGPPGRGGRGDGAGPGPAARQPDPGPLPARRSERSALPPGGRVRADGPECPHLRQGHPRLARRPAPPAPARGDPHRSGGSRHSHHRRGRPGLRGGGGPQGRHQGGQPLARRISRPRPRRRGRDSATIPAAVALVFFSREVPKMPLCSWHASLCLLTLFAVAVAAPATAAANAETTARRPMVPADLWTMERVGDPALSPDGRWVAFTVTRYSVDDNAGDSDLWVVPADGSAPPRRLTWNKGADNSPLWSPDGKRIAFLSKRGDAPVQLYLLPFGEGGEAQPVTKLPVGVQNAKWFADGKRIAFLAATWPDLNDDWPAVQKRADEQKNDKVQAKIGDTRLLRYWDSYRTDGRRNHVFVVDVGSGASGKAEDLTPCLAREMDFFSPTESWDLSPDGQEIAYSVNAVDPPYPTVNFDIFLQPIAPPGSKPAAPRNITGANAAMDSRPRYTPDGKYIVFGRTHRPDIDPDFTRLTRYDRRSGEIVDLAATWDASPDSWSFTPDGKTIVFHAQDHGRTHVWSLPVDGSAATPHLLAKGGTTGGASVGAKAIVYSRHSVNAPAELFTVPLAGGEPKSLTSFNTARMAALDLGTMDEATFEGGGGDPVHMFIVYPP